MTVRNGWLGSDCRRRLGHFQIDATAVRPQRSVLATALTGDLPQALSGAACRTRGRSTPAIYEERIVKSGGAEFDATVVDIPLAVGVGRCVPSPDRALCEPRWHIL
jgi:hypothetical protein